MEETITVGLQHVGIPTNDLEKTEKFYKKIGFQTLLSTENPNNSKKVVFLGCGALILEIYEEDRIKKEAGAIDHIALEVRDIEDARKEMCDKGLKATEIKTLPFWERGIGFFKISGVNGETIEFCQRF